jgi:hypothetical protein
MNVIDSRTSIAGISTNASGSNGAGGCASASAGGSGILLVNKVGCQDKAQRQHYQAFFFVAARK